MVLEWELRERVGKGSFGAVYRGCGPLARTERSWRLVWLCAASQRARTQPRVRAAAARACRLCVRAGGGTARRAAAQRALFAFPQLLAPLPRSRVPALLPPARSVNVSSGEEVAVKIIDLEEACAPPVPSSLRLRTHRHAPNPVWLAPRTRARALTHMRTRGAARTT